MEFRNVVVLKLRKFSVGPEGFAFDGYNFLNSVDFLILDHDIKKKEKYHFMA